MAFVTILGTDQPKDSRAVINSNFAQCAYTSLDNLANVSINASLVGDTPGGLDIGDGSSPWRYFFFSGDGAGAGSGSYVKLTAVPTGPRVITLPDASITVAGSSSALTSGRVPFATTGGLLTDSAGLTFGTTANVTTFTLTAGSSQSSTNLFEIKTNAAALNAALNSSATTWHMRTGLNIWSAAPVGSGFLQAAYQESALFATGKGIIFSSTNQADGTPDASLSRISPGVIGVGTGAAGSVAGTIQAANHSALGNGAASVSPFLGSGTWFTGGSATTTKPYLLIEPSGTTSTAWSTSGTGIGVNAASGFAGRLLDLQVAGSSQFRVSSAGRIDAGIIVGTNIIATLNFTPSGGGNGGYSAPADGVALFMNNAGNDVGGIKLGGVTASFPYLKRSTTGLIARLADDSADTWFQASQFRGTLTTPASASATGVAGTIVWDTDYIYICTATNTWKRVAIATW